MWRPARHVLFGLTVCLGTWLLWPLDRSAAEENVGTVRARAAPAVIRPTDPLWQLSNDLDGLLRSTGASLGLVPPAFRRACPARSHGAGCTLMTVAVMSSRCGALCVKARTAW